MVASFQLRELLQQLGVIGTGSMQRSCLRAVLLETLWITSFPLGLCISKVTLQVVNAHKCVFGICVGWDGREGMLSSAWVPRTDWKWGWVCVARVFLGFFQCLAEGQTDKGLAWLGFIGAAFQLLWVEWWFSWWSRVWRSTALGTHRPQDLL